MPRQLQSLTLASGVAPAALVVALGATLSLAYPERPGLFVLLAILAYSPFVDALCVALLIELRIVLQLRCLQLFAGLCGSSVSAGVAGSWRRRRTDRLRRNLHP